MRTLIGVGLGLAMDGAEARPDARPTGNDSFWEGAGAGATSSDCCNNARPCCTGLPAWVQIELYSIRRIDILGWAQRQYIPNYGCLCIAS